MTPSNVLVCNLLVFNLLVFDLLVFNFLVFDLSLLDLLSTFIRCSRYFSFVFLVGICFSQREIGIGFCVDGLDATFNYSSSRMTS
jgi:hypothetical protein